MPEWWVSEPYISLTVSDTPLSYPMSSGKEMDFRFYYMQRTGLPGADEVPNYYTTGLSPSYTHGLDDYYLKYARSCGTNAAWAHSWMTDIVFWDTVWENSVVAFHGNSYPPFKYGYEAFVFTPQGGVQYYYFTNGVASLRDPKSQALLKPSSPSGYPTASLNPVADAHGIYWGGSQTDGFQIIYPDGSKNNYGFCVYPHSFSKTVAYAAAHAFLTQSIDPQGRITQLGYEPETTGSQSSYRIKYVVDPDGRTNIFQYTSGTAFQLSAIDDPYGRNTTLRYNASGLLTNITDAAGISNAFQYQAGVLVTNPVYCLDSSNNIYPCGSEIVSAASAGWMTSLTTPYGTTAFSYYQTHDSSVTDGYIQRALFVAEPASAHQLFLYQHTNTFVSSTANSPTVPGQSFDDGANGVAGHNALTYRNTFHWGRKQFADLSSTAQSAFGSQSLGAALSTLTTNDYNKAELKHWLLLGSDDISLTESMSSDRDPSPDAAGNIVGLRTWYSYPGEIYETLGSDPQVGCVAQVLPDGTSQFTTYHFYPIQPLGNGLVSDHESSYSLPNGAVGELTNWFEYAANGVDLTTISNSVGQSVTVGYNGYHQITAITNALGQTTSLSWDTTYNTYNLTGVQLPDGETINLNYYWLNPSLALTNLLQSITLSPSGRAFTNNNYQAGSPSSISDDRGVTVGNTWDGLNRLTGTVFPDGTSISNIYSRLDVVAAKDRLNNWSYFSYDGLDHLLVTTNANSAVTTYSWCGCGSLTQIIDALNNTNTLNYDNQGNLTSINYADGSSWTWQYDLAGRMVYAADGLGRALQFAYNNQGLPTTVTSAAGVLRQTIYDAVNRPVSVTDANGITLTNQYDLINELLQRTWPDGISESFGYSPAGLIAYTNRDGQRTLYGRDGAGRLTAVTNANQEHIDYAYDSLNNITSLLDGLNHTTYWQYNQYGWLTNQVDGRGSNVLRYAYNANGWVTNRWTPQNGNAGYTYDNVGNLKTINYGALSNGYAYDALNRLTNLVDAVGTNTWTYTPVGQLASETSPWAGSTVTNTYTQGLRTSLSILQSGGAWTQSYSYDAQWRLTSLTSPAGAFGYTYGFQPASALVTAITLPNAANINNSYDSLARLRSTALVNYWGHILDAATYIPDPLGLRTNLVRNLGLTSSTVTIGYDNLGQLTSWSGAETSGGLLRQNEQLGFAYDAAHNLNIRTNGALLQTFNVDAANELTGVSRSGTFTETGATPAPVTNLFVNGQSAQLYGDFTFARTNLALLNGNNTFTNVALFAYTNFVTNTFTVNLPANVSLAFDYNGNLTNDGTRIFNYDQENQLTNILIPGQWQSSFAYDGLHRRRIARDYTWTNSAWLLTTEVRYICDGRLAIQERDTNGNPLVTYTRGLDLSGNINGAGGIGGLLARTDTNGSTYYHADGNGNITALMDGNENIVARYLYNPYGKLLGQWGPMANANVMEFSSMPQRRGITLYPFRGYEPNFQRFLSQDPASVGGGINFYRYAINSPLNFVDPLGLNALGAFAGSDLGGTIGSYVGGFAGGLAGELGGGAAGTAAEPGAGTIAGGLAGAAAAADIGADVGGTIGSYLGGKLGDLLTGDDAGASSPSLSIPDATVNKPAIPTPTLMCKSKSPPPNNGKSNPHGGPKHNAAIDSKAAEARAAGAENIRKNQAQTDADGNKVGDNRPDLQYDLDGTHYNFEYDNTDAGSQAHQQVLPGNDPNAINEFNILP